METHQIHRAQEIAASSPSRYSVNPASPMATLSFLAASLLILLGAAFQLGLFGVGPYNSSDTWLFSVIGKDMWLALTNFAIPELRELVRMWPLMLVSLGSAILLIAKRWSRFDPMPSTASERKENHAD